jgi:hypothetical protein
MMGTKKPSAAVAAEPLAQDTVTGTAPDPAVETAAGSPSDAAPPAPAFPAMSDIIAALLDDADFNARLMEGLRTVVPGADEMVPAILASEDFVPGLKTLVASNLDALLPAACAAALAETGQFPPVPVVAGANETSIERTAKAENVAAQVAADDAEERAQARGEAERGARANYLALIDTVPEAVAPVDLQTVNAAGLVLDNGSSFSIDYSLPIEPAALSLDDNGAIRLRHDPISIGDDMIASFPVKGVVLIMQGEEGMRAARCEMTSPLMVGGGQRAQLGADSLIFRIPR